MPTTDKKKLLRQIILTLALLLPIVFAFKSAQDMSRYASQRAALKQEYSVVNSIRYGLLSVDRWRDNIAELVAQQIDQFKLNNDQEKTLRASLNEILNALITQGEKMMNEKQHTMGDKLKRLAFKTFVDTDKIRQRVPEFSQTIINEIKNPRNKKRMKFLASGKLEEMAEQTRDKIVEQSDYDKLLEKFQTTNLTEINARLSKDTEALQEKIFMRTFQIICMVFLFLLIWFLIRKQRDLYHPMFAMSVILSLIVLYVGLSSPMIEIDARIKEVDFLLMNKSIKFTDQVIFFQSKSILDVVHILLTTHKADSIFVGILILTFSVLFPVAKLLSTEIYLSSKKNLRSNPLINFFAFKSGKWSMADVMVVAIFMAYVGFNGILDNQLQILNMKTQSIGSIATNNTSLQPGFLLFISFVLFSLVLSEILKQITKRYRNDISH